MRIALDKDGNRINAEYADKTKQYICPVCGAEVTPRQGELNVWHFAHKTECECLDTWSYDMSEWHKEMQHMFPTECQEVVIKNNNEMHRADILVDNIVIEFQHSSISEEEFCARNEFYLNAGYKLAWVFDMRDADLEYAGTKYGVEIIRYKHPKRFLRSAPKIGSNEETFAIWFCQDDGEENFFSKVIWHTPDWTRLVHDVHYLEKGAKAADFITTTNERIEAFLEGCKYNTKRMGQKKYPRDAYVCPRSGEFGLKLYGETACSYCRYCRLIVDRWKEHDIYCTYPEQCNPLAGPYETHPGYECTNVNRFMMID